MVIVEGRPLRGWHGRVQRARARLGHSHLTDTQALRLPGGVRRTLADHWRLQGELLHSSYVAYLDLARRLATLDAPAELVGRSELAARQAGANGARCFELAGRYLGRSMEHGRLRRPMRLPRTRHAELKAVAVGTLLDGVLLEAYAARMAAARADRATDPRAADALKAIAADELSRSALSRDILDWCLSVGGSGVRQAVHEAALDLPTHGPFVLVPRHSDRAALADHGQYDADPRHEQFAELTKMVRQVYLARTAR